MRGIWRFRFERVFLLGGATHLERRYVGYSFTFLVPKGNVDPHWRVATVSGKFGDAARSPPDDFIEWPPRFVVEFGDQNGLERNGLE
jgi:hypothetical protein